MYWDKYAIECLCIRILSCAKVTSNRALGTWLSYEDLIRIVLKSTKIENLGFEIGKGIKLKNGDDVTIVATGHLVWEALEAAKELESQGINSEVINIHTIKPLDNKIIID